MNELEYFFQCPYCWQTISMLLEPRDETQSYIEDCEVCCQPIKLNYLLKQEDELINFAAVSIEQ